MNEKDLFEIKSKDHVCRLIFNRPDKHNAMGLAFFDILEALFTGFDRDPAIRVVIVDSRGPSFTSGIDLEDVAALLSGGGADQREVLRIRIRRLQQALNSIEACRKPVIAAVHGNCIGGGVDLISACDIRFADRSAVFSIREARMGIVADLGTLQRLPGIIGEGWTRELAYSGRDFGAEEAYRMGLITRLCEDRRDLQVASQQVADRIAENPPLTVQGTKDVINTSRDHGTAAGLAYAAQKNAAMLLSEDLQEAVAAFKQKRKPVFKGK